MTRTTGLAYSRCQGLHRVVCQCRRSVFLPFRHLQRVISGPSTLRLPPGEEPLVSAQFWSRVNNTEKRVHSAELETQ